MPVSYNSEETQRNITQLVTLRNLHQDRLQQLRKRLASAGREVPAEVATEAEEIAEKIAVINHDLVRLSASLIQDTPPDPSALAETTIIPQTINDHLMIIYGALDGNAKEIHKIRVYLDIQFTAATELVTKLVQNVSMLQTQVMALEAAMQRRTQVLTHALAILVLCIGLLVSAIYLQQIVIPVYYWMRDTGVGHLLTPPPPAKEFRP